LASKSARLKPCPFKAIANCGPKSFMRLPWVGFLNRSSMEGPPIYTPSVILSSRNHPF
jgi:hypothetical protein